MTGVFIGVCSQGDLKIECVQSLLAASVTKTTDFIYLHKGHWYADDARNKVVDLFYHEEFETADRLLMVDSDIEFAPEDVTRLVDDDLPIVAGVYHSQYGTNMLPVVYETGGDGPGMEPIMSWPDGPIDREEWEEPIIAVEGVGAGFLMVKREVFDRLWEIYGKPCPWFAEDIIDGVHFGEDLCFCRRARDAGFPVRVDRRVQVAHHKQVRMGGRITAAMAGR